MERYEEVYSGTVTGPTAMKTSTDSYGRADAHFSVIVASFSPFVEIEDDDFTEIEVSDILESLKDYREGRFRKFRSASDLFDDLDS